jgi:hypothetical protein
MPTWTPSTLWPALPWLLSAAALLFAWRLATRTRPRPVAPPHVDLTFHDWSALRLLPLPCADDRAAILDLLRDFAPGRSLAVFSVGDPPLLVGQRQGDDTPGPAQSRWIEIHRAALSRGETVVEAACGTLVPAFTRAGLWRGVVIVAGPEPLPLAGAQAATLKLLAGTLEYAFLLTAWLHTSTVVRCREHELARPT